MKFSIYLYKICDYGIINLTFQNNLQSQFIYSILDSHQKLAINFT